MTIETTQENTVTRQVDIYEDNSGGVYLAQGDACWGIGAVTADYVGRAAEDAEAWANGDWEPSEDNGQYPGNFDGLDHIATWTPADGITVHRSDNGEILAGGGGRAYLGLSDEEN